MTTSSSTKPPDERQEPPRPGSYYGTPFYLTIDGYPGKIIAIEGTDGAGAPRRSGCCVSGSRCRATA